MSNDQTPATTAWQPIDIAPKDGTVIIATDDSLTVFCYWKTYPAGSYTDGNWTYKPPPVPSRDPMWHFYPTHWVPAPSRRIANAE